MFFEELINHLFNIKILASLNRYKNTVEEYLNNITTSAKLRTELKLKEEGLIAKLVKQIIDKSGEISFTTFEDKTKIEISKLLKEVNIEDPIFGSIGIELSNILVTIKKSNGLREYIFGKPAIFQSGYFGKEPFNKKHNGINSEEGILDYYTQLKNFQLTESFIEYLKLLESISMPLKKTLEHIKTDLQNTIKNKTSEEKMTHIRALNKDSERVLEQSSYLVVSDVINYDCKNDIELANFLHTFTTNNALEPYKLIDLKHYFITLFFHAFIKNNFDSFIKNILVQKDETFALLQQRNSLAEFVLLGNIEDFENIEKQLIKEDYFDSFAKWIGSNKKTKDLLVEFILHCHLMGYFKLRANNKINKELTKLRYFFEERYSIIIKEQFKPHKREKFTIPSNEFRWIEKAL